MNRYQVHCCRSEAEWERPLTLPLDAGTAWEGVATPPLLRLGPEVVDDLLELLGRVGERLLGGRLAENDRLEMRRGGRLPFLPEVVGVLVRCPERPRHLGELPADGIGDPERLRGVPRR